MKAVIVIEFDPEYLDFPSIESRKDLAVMKEVVYDLAKRRLDECQIRGIIIKDDSKKFTPDPDAF